LCCVNQGGYTSRPTQPTSPGSIPRLIPAADRSPVFGGDRAARNARTASAVAAPLAQPHPAAMHPHVGDLRFADPAPMRSAQVCRPYLEAATIECTSRPIGPWPGSTPTFTATRTRGRRCGGFQPSCSRRTRAAGSSTGDVRVLLALRAAMSPGGRRPAERLRGASRLTLTTPGYWPAPPDLAVEAVPVQATSDSQLYHTRTRWRLTLAFAWSSSPTRQPSHHRLPSADVGC